MSSGISGRAPSVGAPKTTADYLTALTGGTKPSSESSNDALARLLSGTAQPNTTVSPLMALLSGNSPSSAPLNGGLTSPEFNADPSATVAERGVDARAAKADPSGAVPLTFAAALRLAEQRSGKFDSTPYTTAIGADQAAAATQTHQAQQLGHRAQQDDAALYGHLANYIDRLSGQDQAATRQTQTAIGNNYDRLEGRLGHVNANLTSETNQALAGRGLTPSAAGSLADSLAYQRGRTETDRTAAHNETRQQGDDFSKLLNQSKADVITTGTGKVADEKAATNTAIENIAASLAQQVSGVNVSEAQAESAANSSLRAMAASILTSNDPNSPTTQKELAQIALMGSETLKNIKEAHAIQGANSDPYSTKNPQIAPNSKVSQAEDYLSLNAPTGHAGTLDSILDYYLKNDSGLTAGQLGSPTINDAIATLTQRVNKRSGQGYGPKDIALLTQAYLSALGK